MASQTVWWQLTDKMEHDKYPYTNFLEIQYSNFLLDLDNYKTKKALIRLHWSNFVHSLSYGSLSDGLANISSGIEP